MENRILVFIFIIIFVASGTFPERPDITFRYLTVEDGLSQGSINCIYQDSIGFLWFGTKQGLNKYDGFNIKIFDHNPADLSSLSNNNVNCITEDKNGDLWIGTSAGLNRLNNITQTFTRYIANPLDPNSLANDSILCLLVDTGGILWIGTKQGLDRFDPKNEIFLHFTHDPNEPDSLSIGQVNVLTEDKAGNIWVGTDHGLDRFNKGSERFTHYTYDINKIPLTKLMDSYQDKQGRLFLLFLNTPIDEFNFETETISPVPMDISFQEKLTTQLCTQMSMDYMGRFWIVTPWEGVFILDLIRNDLIHIGMNKERESGLSYGYILSLYAERGGSIIIGTDGTGANIWHPFLQKFRLYRHDPDNPDTLGLDSVRSFYEDHEGNLWIGGYGGLNKYDRKTGQFTDFYGGIKDSKSIIEPVLVIKEDVDDPLGTLWMGTESNNLIKFDLLTETIERFPVQVETSDEGSTNLLRALHCDESGILWIGARQGLYIFDKTTEKFKRYQPELNTSESIDISSVNVIYENKFKELWIGTQDKGLFRVDQNSNTFKNYIFDQNDIESSGLNSILSLYEDQTGVLWIGTSGGGLIRFENLSGEFQVYNDSFGLPNNVIYGILEDEQGNLWLSTNTGISKFNPKQETFSNYGVEDNLQSLEFNYNAYFKSRSGEMFFGGVNGFNAFYPDEVEQNPFVPPVVITNFQIFNRPVGVGESVNGKIILKEHISRTDTIRLSYKEKMISFEYAALQYAAPEKSEYAHILEGFESEWNYVGNRRYASYSNLDPGKYTFRVKATNNDGLWNETGASLKIIIVPPFWATWWFKVLAILISVAIILLVYEIRTLSVKKRSRHLEKINLELSRQITQRKKVEEKLKKSLKEKGVLLQEIHHRVKNNMQIISSLLRLQSEQNQDGKIEDENRISQDRIRSMALIHDMLYQSNDFAEIDFSQYIEKLITYLKKIYLTDNDNVKILTDLEKVFLDLNTSVPCGLILNELVTNSLKHAFPSGQKGEINIILKKNKGNKIQISVSDNGVGFPDDYDFENPRSLGLTLVKDLVRQLDGQIEYSGESGTSLLISFS